MRERDRKKKEKRKMTKESHIQHVNTAVRVPIHAILKKMIMAT